MTKIDIDFRIEDRRWEALDIETLAEKAIVTTLEASGRPGDYEISLLVTDDTEMAQLNAEFLGKDKPTNVLSFPAENLAPLQAGNPPFKPTQEELGNIALGFDVCESEAADAGKEFAEHVTHLLVHGCLHLLGFDHKTEADAAMMEGLEISTLARMGYSNPYS